MEWRPAETGTDGFFELRLEGDCDLYAAPRFAAAVLEKVGSGTRRLRLDFTGVRYLDSTGVGAIIRIVQACRMSGADLRFRGISGTPRQVLRLTNILHLLVEDAGSKELL